MYDVMDIMTEGRAKSCLCIGERGRREKEEREKQRKLREWRVTNEKKENGLKHKLKTTH